MNGAFSVGTDPGPALLTDGQQMAFCVQRERERGDRERGRKEETHREDGGGGGLELFSLGPLCRSKMPYHMTCLTFGPHSAKTVRILSNREHKASQPQRPLFTPRAAILQR